MEYIKLFLPILNLIATIELLSDSRNGSDHIE
jgi:hypothetical protein